MLKALKASKALKALTVYRPRLLNAFSTPSPQPNGYGHD